MHKDVCIIWVLIYVCSMQVCNKSCHFTWRKIFQCESWSSLTSKPRLLNLILLNLTVRWPTGAAIVRPPNTEYTQSIAACWEKLPKIVKITLLQFNYEFGHGNFFTVWTSQYFQNIYRRKKISINGNSHNLVTKLQQVPCFRDVCLFSIQMKPFNHSKF